jgi:CheY-like chemotaxis protein
MANILWVEDDYERIKGLGYFLEEEGHKFIAATTKKEAFQILDERKNFDLIIIDLILSEGEDIKPFDPFPGFKVLKRLKDLNLDVPIIVLTIVEDTEILNRLNKYKIVELLKKGGFKPSELREAVHRVLGKHEKY